MGEHTPTPWEYRDVSGAGLEIRAPVYQVTGVELPKGMPEAPIMTFQLAPPQNVIIAAERWIQFEPKGWGEMQEANAAFIVKAANHFDDLVASLKAALNMVDGDGFPPDWDFLRRTLKSAEANDA